MDLLIKNNKLSGQINAPASKSYAHRAIFIASLAKDESCLKISSMSEDIHASLEAVKAFGAEVYEEDELIHIQAGQGKNKARVNVGESGTSLRFALAMAGCLGRACTIVRSGSLVERPVKVFQDLFREKGLIFNELGPNFELSGQFSPGNFEVDGGVSSQFISGLLIGLSNFPSWSEIKVTGDFESRAYVGLTLDVLKDFSVDIRENERIFKVKGRPRGRLYEVEGDWSNGLFFLLAGCTVKDLKAQSLQGDRRALDFIEKLGYKAKDEDGYILEKIGKASPERILDAREIPDAVPILSVFAAKEAGLTRIINGKRLRYKESDRIKSTVDLLKRLGVKVYEEEEGFYFFGRERFLPARINSYNDHRIAMAASIASVWTDGEIFLENASCVNKSYPSFFEDFKKLGGDFIVK